MNKNLVLLGMMAVGKTTLGKIVAKRTGLKFIDTAKSCQQPDEQAPNPTNLTL